MKIKLLKICALLLSIVITVGFTACDKALTAYEIAVENGFVGTEAEWLESLKGKDGLDGARGEDGKDATALTIEDIYLAAKNAGYDKDFLTFIKEYFSSSLTEYNIESAVNSAILSVVDVFCTFDIGEKTVNSAGSGVIYKLDKQTGDALVLTNYHVVYSADSIYSNKISKEISLYLYGSELESGMISATYIGGSMTYDIAVLEVKGSEVLKNSNAKAVEIADSNYLKVGSTAIAVGNPDAGGISATVGVISVDSEYITMLGADEASTITFRSIRVDAAVNPGNSGGGLFNAKGQLIGIVNAKTVKEDIENMGYAIPSTLAVYVAENIIWNASNGNTGVLKGLMGVEVTTKESKAVYNEELQMVEIVETVSVNKITPGSLASKFMQEGDIFVSVSSRDKEIKCTRMFMVVDFMLSVRPGDQITVTFIRNGVEMQKTVTIEREYFSAIV
ncbi:MAG: trypsin-like peptidase domain-containing protein [Clostridia bacterium]|nr:trypsin-like peptidase domain-containing protein [Clostridia bacterium]